MTRTILTTAASAALIAVLGTSPAYAGDMKAKHFSKVDANADAKVDFTEFYNYVSKYGASDTDAAQEFVRLAGEDNLISQDGFAAFDKANLKAKHAGSMHSSSEVTVDTSYQTANSGTITTFSNDQMVVLGTTSVSGDFASYDANSDGMVNYKEYAKVASKDGVSKTAAAREFIQISGGQTQFDENAFNMVQYTSAPSYDTSSEMSGTSYIQPAAGTVMTDTEMTYSSETSGAYMAPSIDVAVDPTVGVEVETENPVEETWEDTKDATSNAWEKTKDVTSDAWDATKDAASDTMEKAEDIVEPDQ